MISRLLALVAVALASTVAPSLPSAPRVEHVAVPDGGIQAQAAIDARGTIHLLYYKGEAGSGDLYYVRRDAAQPTFSAPIRVNSQSGSAIAAGAVRGGHLALGRGGWIHVAWNAARPVDVDGTAITPMWYTRLAPGARAFEPQRAIGQHTKNLDGGGTVAADAAGHVYVVWHAMGREPGEMHRPIFVAASNDDGGAFATDRVFDAGTGACSCCGAAAVVDTGGRLQIVYRAAGDGIHRDATWLTVVPQKTLPSVRLQPWNLAACPMTTFALAQTRDTLVGAWMSEQQIYTAGLDPATRIASAPSPMSGNAVRNHPAVAVNAAGVRLFAWIEGANRSRDGSVAWELRDRKGTRLDTRHDAGAIPPLSLIGAVARADGSFVLFY